MSVETRKDVNRLSTIPRKRKPSNITNNSFLGEGCLAITYPF